MALYTENLGWNIMRFIL